MWQTVISALIAALVTAPATAGLAWLVFKGQLRRNSVMQVYLDVIPALFETDRIVELRIQHHVNQERLSAAEHEEISKAVTSLLGRIGKLRLVASLKTVDAINVFSDALLKIHAGVVPETAEREDILITMKATDIDAQLVRFQKARDPLLTSMREDLGYKMWRLKIKSPLMKKSLLNIKSLLKKISPLDREPLLIKHDSFSESFFSRSYPRG